MINSAEIKVMIFDDNWLFAHEIKDTVELDPSVRVVGQAANAQQVLDIIEKHAPHFMLASCDMKNHESKDFLKKFLDKRGIDCILYGTLPMDAK